MKVSVFLAVMPPQNMRVIIGLMKPCPDCAHENIPGVAFCDECGFDLSAVAAASDSQSPLTNDAPASPPVLWNPSPSPVVPTLPPPNDEEDAGDPFGDPFSSSAPASPSVPATAPVASFPAPMQGTAPNGVRAPAPSASLTIERNGTVGKSYQLEPTTLVGKWDMDAGIFPEVDTTKDDPDGYISRKHAQLEWTGVAWMITDLGSTNGTALNRVKLSAGQAAALTDNDEIIVGRLFLRFKAQ